MKTVATRSQVQAVKRRIARFYQCLNDGDFESCFRTIDPMILAKPSSVTLLQYEQSLRRFMSSWRHVSVERIDVDLHLDEPSQVFLDRDFAIGRTLWKDEQGVQRTFLERWVRDGRRWYTLMTGFAVPQSRDNGRATTRRR
jgi:hypothetical protein